MQASSYLYNKTNLVLKKKSKRPYNGHQTPALRVSVPQSLSVLRPLSLPAHLTRCCLYTPVCSRFTPKARVSFSQGSLPCLLQVFPEVRPSLNYNTPPTPTASLICFTLPYFLHTTYYPLAYYTIYLSAVFYYLLSFSPLWNVSSRWAGLPAWFTH